MLACLLSKLELMSEKCQCTVAYIYQTQMLFVSSNKVLIWVFCKLCVQGREFTKSLDIHVNVATNDTFPSSFSMLFLFRMIIS